MRSPTVKTSAAEGAGSEFWPRDDVGRLQAWSSVEQVKVRILTLWAMAAGMGVAAILFAQTVLIGLSFEALTAHKVVSTGEDYAAPGRHLAYVMIPQTRYGGRVYWSLFAVLVGAFVLALLSGAIWRVITRRPGWRGLVLLTVVMPGALAVLAMGLWYQVASHLLTWGMPYVLLQALVIAAGHALGMLVGWRLANLLVWAVLPRSAREAVAMLACDGWYMDAPPRPRPADVAPFTTSTSELTYLDSL